MKKLTYKAKKENLFVIVVFSGKQIPDKKRFVKNLIRLFGASLKKFKGIVPEGSPVFTVMISENKGPNK
jgi:hypothetical protein